MKITIDDDLDLDKIINSGQCFRPKKTGDRSYTFITGEHTVDITDVTDRPDGCCDMPSGLEVSCSQKEWDEIWHPYFDLDTDYRKIRNSIPEDDVFLKNAARFGAGIRILRQDKFETLISFIISQRKSIPAIRSCVEKLVGSYGKNGFFPKPDELMRATGDELRSCGLGYRVPYIMKTTETVACGKIDLEAIDGLSDDELFDRLKSFNGVGDKVANCVELFAYHRTGRAPVDTWIARVIRERYNGKDPFPRYKNTAGIMQQYMFYYAQNRQDKSLLQ